MSNITSPSLWDPIDKNLSPKFLWPILDECDPAADMRMDDGVKLELPDPRDEPTYVAKTALDNCELGFGKYRYKTPVQLLETDPGYIVWVYEQTERGCCSEDLYNQAKKIYVPTKR